MNPSEERVREVFELVAAEPPGRWPEMLDRECETEALRARVQALLDRYAKSSGFLSTPAAKLFAGMDAFVGPQLAEFQIAKEIGRGGMGVVYLADDTVLRRTVALKVLPPHAHASVQAQDRFRREAQAIARLRHAGIVQIFRYGEERGYIFMAMELVEGQTLRAALDDEVSSSQSRADLRSKRKPRRGPGPDKIVAVARRIADLAEALDHAHKLGVIHRDIKPSNILLPSEGNARITDFGIAKLVAEETLSSDAEIAGSYLYMSPEQARVLNEPIDPRSDVFSLGAVLYECLTYTRPFEGATPQDIFKALGECRPELVTKVNPAVSRDLAVICHKAIEKFPADRYQTMAHLAADLRCFLEGRPILARPPSLPRRVRHALSRHRIAVLAALLVAASGTAGGIYLQAQHLKLERFAWLSVDSPGMELDAFIQEQDQTTMLLGPPIKLGQTPLSRITVAPGVYRLLLEDGQRKRKAEMGLLLVQPGSGNLTHIVAATQPTSNIGNSTRSLFVRMADAEALYRGMRRIEGGTYRLGVPTPKNEVFRTERMVRLEPFWIDVSAVSNAEYKAFAAETGHPLPSHLAKDFPAEFNNRPVIAITLADAQAYARWRGKRLPTSYEWEAAARGKEGRLYPWGNDLSDAPPGLDPTVEALLLDRSPKAIDHLNEYFKHTVDVQSPDPLAGNTGLLHLYNNVWELTDTVSISDGVFARGRSWLDSPSLHSLGDLFLRPVDRGSYKVGFRCAVGDVPNRIDVGGNTVQDQVGPDLPVDR